VSPRGVQRRVETRVLVEPAVGEGLRRGLPRVVGGEPWPPEGTVPPVGPSAAAPVSSALVEDAPVSSALVEDTPVGSALVEDTPVGSALVEDALVAERGVQRRDETQIPVGVSPVPVPVPVPVSVGVDLSVPLGFRRSVFVGVAPSHPVPVVGPRRVGLFTWGQWAGVVIVGGLGVLFVAVLVVLGVRVLVSVPFMREFLHAYPGVYALPVSAPVGFPGWLNWQHFLNVFFLVLIVRTGLRVRGEKRPRVFWSPRGVKKRKLSLTLWSHQALDVLWVVNGVVFVVLLFVSGQWMRLVPTSWSVVPNAVSAALQYASLEWPVEDGWVNYNSLQQLTYFGVVFVLAPLAIVTGVRMSHVWPRNATRLNRVYPVEWARAVHFPVMVVFVVFVVVHVFLVFATGVLRNLNHMYGASDVVDWVGFCWFTASLLVITAGLAALRPLILAPIARLFGTVTAR